MKENSNLEKIKRVHKLDCKIINLQKKHEQLPGSLRQLDRAVENKDKDLQEAEGQLKALRSRYDKRELELQAHEAELAKYETQLKAVKTNKEYSAILSEIASKKADVAKTEDEMLIRMEEIEQQQKTIQSIKQKKEVVSKDREDHKDEITTQLGEVERQLQQLLEARKHEAAELPREILHQYERILAKRGKTAVVPVVDNSCQGCFMKMTPEVQAQLLRNDSLIYCKFCSRIIYLE